MKHCLISALLLCCSFVINAQTPTPDFSFTPDSVSIIVPATDTDEPADLHIHSDVQSDIMVRWLRNTLLLTPGCQTQVCDLNACYDSTSNTKTFPLAAGAEGPISIHLVNNTGATCQAIIRLDLWNKDVPSIIVPAIYMFNITSSTNEVFQLADVKVYPNPATHYFTIENDQVATIRMKTLDGRETATFDATQTKTFSLAGQTAGMYVLLMEDAAGKAIGIAQLDVK